MAEQIEIGERWIMGRLGVLALVGMLSGVVPMQAAGQSSVEPRTIRVTGVGEVRTTPDLATIQFGVETTGSTAQEAAQRNAQQMEQVLQALLRAGVRRDQISTSGFGIYPEYEAPPRSNTGEPQPPRIRGYRAMNQLSVRTTELAGIGGLIDAALAAGANQMMGVSFEVRNASEAESAALRQAVSNARTSALVMAEALGVRLGPILDASTGTEPIRPLLRAQAMRADLAMESFAATPIEPGEQSVRATASLIFAIE